MLWHLFTLLLTFYLLSVVTDRYFIPALDRIAGKLQLNSEVAGATLMAIGSSAPEFFTALISVMRTNGASDIGAGTIVGSAIFNILVIIGVSAMFRKAKLTWQPVFRDLIFYSISIVLMVTAFWDGHISPTEALMFVALYLIYSTAVYFWQSWLGYQTQELEESSEGEPAAGWQKFIYTLSDQVMLSDKSGYAILWRFGLSIVLIGVLSYLMVESAIFVSYALKIHPAIIALTVLAAGTSIPDLISSVIVAKQGRGDMAISNAVGSNIFDILIGLGAPWLFAFATGRSSITVATENLLSSMFLLLATVVAVSFLLIIRRWEIGRRAGFVLVLLYLAYLLYNINQVLTR